MQVWEFWNPQNGPRRFQGSEATLVELMELTSSVSPPRIPIRPTNKEAVYVVGDALIECGFFLFLKGSIFVISWYTPASRQDKKDESHLTLSIGESDDAGIRSTVKLIFLLFVVVPSQRLTLRLVLVNKI